MTDQTFKAGDRVQYRGDGVVMYVILNSGTLSYCGWMTESGEKKFGTYETQNLVPYAAGTAKSGPASEA